MSILKKVLIPVGTVLALTALVVHVEAESYFKKSWGLFSTYGVDAPKAWSSMKRDCSKSQVVVAVMRPGVRANHAALKDTLWKNPKGAADELGGWDFARNSGKIVDTHGHGTHIAGIIAGNEVAGPMGNGFKGVCPGVKIMSLRYYDERASGAENLKNTIKAINYAVDNGATIINYSGGGAEFSGDEYRALKRARDKGILVVAAAGNERSNADKALYYPAAYSLDNIISVAAIDSTGSLISASNWGIEKVHVAAPGHSILSALPGGGFGYMSGTSQATAFVSGIASLVMTENPALAYRDVKRVIEESALRQPTLVGKTKTSGRANALAALEKSRETRRLSATAKATTALKGAKTRRNPSQVRKGSTRSSVKPASK